MKIRKDKILHVFYHTKNLDLNTYDMWERRGPVRGGKKYKDMHNEAQ